MDYPKRLTPIAFNTFQIEGHTAEIPKAIIQFNAWNGKIVENTFSGKPVLNLNDNPVFAELAIMHIFKEDGWDARWIETYGKPKLRPIHLTEWMDEPYKNQEHNPIDNKLIQFLLNAIAKNNNNSFAGCWDVVAWKNDQIIFAESKCRKKDFIKTTQNKWLKSAFEIGLSEENFLLIEWKIEIVPANNIVLPK